MDAFGGGAFEEGTAHGLEDHVAIALWLPPGVESDGETVMSLMRESMDDQTYEDISGVFEQMDEHHPTHDHWYLPLMGVEPVAQGRRLGSILLQHALETCDRDGRPAYLEATRPPQPQPLRPPWLRRRCDDPGRKLAATLGDAP